MKLKTLAALCKSEGRFYLYEETDKSGEYSRQWLSNGMAAYPLDGIPRLTEDHLCYMFDINEKQREKLFFRVEELPVGLNFADFDNEERQIDREPLSIATHGVMAQPFFTSAGVTYINADALKPLLDIIDTVEFYERRAANGVLYIVAKSGMLIAGLIMPCNIADSGFADKLDSLARHTRRTFEQQQERERKEAAKAAVISEQKSIYNSEVANNGENED